MNDTHQYHFRASIDPETIDERADERGFVTRAEYLRALVREDLQRAERER
jgi:metal-responsive CopG/Arc/MetJ family transcriptional regulator